MDVDKLIAKEQRRLSAIDKKKSDAVGVATRIWGTLCERSWLWKGESGEYRHHGDYRDKKDFSFVIYHGADYYAVTISEAYVKEQAPVIFEEFSRLDVDVPLSVTVNNGGRQHRTKKFGPKGE